MTRISHSSLLITSFIIWFVGILKVLETASILGVTLIHLATAGYLTGIFFWGRSKRSDDPKVTFWNKTPVKTSITNGLGNVFRVGMAFNAMIFIPVIIASNWLPYSNITSSLKNKEEIQSTLVKELDLIYQLGEPVYFNSLQSSSTDSTVTIQYRASGKYEQGIVNVTVNNEDSIIDMSFTMENR